MERIVTTQAQLLREVTRLAGERNVNADKEQLVLDRLEVLDGVRVVRRREPATTLRRGKRSAASG